MIRFLLLSFVLFSFTLKASSQRKKSKDSQNFIIQELAPGIWAAIHNDQFGKAICNAGIIDLGDKTIVFDPFMTPEAARELRKIAEDLFQRPVTIVVNSHFHNDHIRGNQEFVPFATIISSTFTRDEIAKVEPGQQEWEKKNAPVMLKATRKIFNSASGAEKEELPIWIGYYEGMMESNDDLKITLPDIVFNDSLWIMGSKRNVKLVEFKNCHTASDVALLIPSDQIAFMGDLLFVQRHPWLADGEPLIWQKNLTTLFNDPSIQTYVPGHGPVCKKQALKDLNEYISSVEKLAIAADADSSQSRLLLQPIPAPYNSWHFGRFYQSNMKFVLSSLHKQER